MKNVLVCLVVGAVSVAGTLLAQSDAKPLTVGRSICVPYDPAGLTLIETKETGTWRLQRGDGAIFQQFADREDAEAGLEVAKAHTQLCYIGKSNTRRNRTDYIMEYWK